MVRLRQILGITVEEMDELVLEHVMSGNGSLQFEGQSALAKYNWTYRDLVDRVLELERKTIGVSDLRCEFGRLNKVDSCHVRLAMSEY